MTKNFPASELVCRCGCGMLPKQDFMDKVQALREEYGLPMPVTGPARCPAHNAKVSKTGLTGPHTTGRALDFGVLGADALDLIVLARKHGFTGIGVNQKGGGRFIHLDDLPNGPGCPRPYCWSY